MYFSNIDFNVVYIDPSIATAGDGTTPAKALKTLSATSSALAENTCYLIRRTAETSAVTLPAGTCSVANLLFIGMSKATDPFYKLMPSAAQSAWGSDSAEYANLKAVTTSGSLTLPNIKNFALNRIYLFRDATAATQPVFAFTNTTNIGAFSIDHCKFGAKGVNLELSSYTTPVTTSYSRAFVHVKSARVFSLKNTIINHVANSGGYGSGSVHSVYLETANYVAVSNVQIFVTTSQYGSGGPSGSVGVPLQMSNSGSGMFASFENITFNLLLNGAYEYLPQLFSGSGYSHVCMRNIRVETVRQLGSAPAKLSVASPLMSCANADEFRVENITVNLPECWLIESSGRVFSFSGSSTGGMAGSGNSVPGYEKVIQNVTIQMAETNGLDSSGNGMYYNTLKNSQYLNYYAALELNFSSYYGGAESVLADNITVNHPRGVAFYGSGMQMANSRFKGSVRCSGMVADLDSVATWYPGYAIYVKDNSTVRVRQLTLGKENAEACGGDVNDIGVASSYSDYCFLYVDASNAPLRSNTTSASSTNNAYGIICGSETDDGHFVHRTENCICDTWNVYRTGGAPASLKIWNNSYNATTDLSLGRAPFKGIQITPETTGVKTLKIYAAAKNLTDLTELYKKLIVQLSVPNGDGADVYYSSTDGSWSPDTTSTWNNDSGLTQYVLAIPVTIHTTAAIDVKIHFNWYSQAGFLYIDPKFTLE